jgi:hypothetical protein
LFLVTLAFGVAAGATTSPGRRVVTSAAVPPEASTADKAAAARTVRAPLPRRGLVTAGDAGPGFGSHAERFSSWVTHEDASHPTFGGVDEAGGQPGVGRAAGAFASGVGSVAASRNGKPCVGESFDAIRPFSGSGSCHPS